MKNQTTLFAVILTIMFYTLSCNPFKTNSETNKTNTIETNSVNPKSELFGVDISHHQDTIAWSEIDTQLVSFIFIKATGGLDYLDPMFSINWDNSKKSKIKRGAYHFYYTTDDPEKQAAFFIKTVGELTREDLPPVLDIESHSVDSETNPEKFQQDILKWLKMVEENMHKRPIIYTSNTFANKYISDTIFSKYHLWIAEYEVDTPKIPKIWSDVKWKFWQNSYSDTIKGIKKQVDHNIFKGDLKELLDL